VEAVAGGSAQSLTLSQLEAMTYTQINASAEVLELAQEAGYSSIQELMPGLGMFFSDVGNL
jgi:hypothetical protein